MEHLGNYLTGTDVLRIKTLDVVHWKGDGQNLFIYLLFDWLIAYKNV